MTQPVADNDISATLAEQYPAIPLQSVVRCVWDAQAAVEFAGVADEERVGLVTRLAQAHLEELAPFYPADSSG